MTNIMNQQGQIEDIAAFNENSLQELNWAIESSGGEFSLILAHCNSASLRQRLTQQLQASCRVEIRKIILEQAVTTLYTTIQAELGNEHPEAIIVSGLESVKAIDSMLTGANQVREEFRKNFPFPVVLWVTDEVLQKLIRLAPDLQSWTTTVEFAISTEDWMQSIQQTADEVFAKVLEVGAGRFLDNTALNLGIASPRRTELELARVELQNRGVTLHPEIESSLEFVLGRDARGSMEQSRQHYERSLAILQQAAQEDKGTGEGTSLHLPISPPPHSPLPTLLERRACLLYCMGLWWRTYAVLHHTESDRARATAKDYFQECITVFDQANREDLVANFINGLGAVLQRMQCWDELEPVARRAITLHQTYPHPFRLARAYGFQAEVALAKLAWKEAQESAQQALRILDNAASAAENSVSDQTLADLEWEQSSHRGWYLFALARAQIALGEKKEAIATLETAKAQTKPQYDPELYILILCELRDCYIALGEKKEAIATLETAKAQNKPQYDPKLYIQILCELRDCYFGQSEYLKAFHIKQELRANEQKYGFRAFIGAGRLQPKQQIINPALVLVEQQETVAQEIAATGREQDIKRLVERVGRPDHKLTIIYGQSGVGKSSILQAGLIPVLKHKAIGTRDVVPVLQQVYPDWIRELGDRLAEAIAQRRTSPPTPPLVGEGRQTPPFPSREGGLGGLGLSDTKSFTSNPLPINGEGAGDGVSAILNQLQINADNELLTVLIFDQFEEFFFVYKDPKQRLTFYNFLRESLDVPHARVILSLRQDYLYYLLECNERLTNLEVINNNILDKHILYYLGNFLRKDAKSLIESLSHTTKLLLEPSLIDAFVEDLAGDFGEIRPIELQVVGTQLQTDKITTLAQYKKHGLKEKLLGRFLEEVVKDCGPDNEQIVKVVLYLLTDENNTRPLKTRADLELELEVRSETLDLVLLILVKSGLVFKVPAVPADHYQLVHDYLVLFIRQQQSQRLIAELEKEREQRKLTEARLVEVLTQQLLEARRGLVWKVSLGVIAGGLAIFLPLVLINQNNAQLVSMSTKSQGLLKSNQDSEALVEALRAGKQLKQWWSIGVKPETRMQVMTALQDVVYTIRERNTLEGHTDSVTRVSFSPDGKMVASGSADGTVIIWNRNGSKLHSFKAHDKEITRVDLSPDGQKLISTSADKTAKLWTLDGKVITTFKELETDFTSLNFSPDSQKMVSGSADGTIKLWSLDGKVIKNFQKQKESITSIRFSPDGETIASASRDGIVKLWDMDGKVLKSLNNNENNSNNSVISLSFSPDSKTIAGMDSNSRSLRLWRRDGSLFKIHNINSDCGQFSFSRDGQTIACANSSSAETFIYVTLLQIDTGDITTFRLPGHKNQITDLSFSPDLKMLASASYDKTVKFWSLERRKFQTPDNTLVTNASFSPNGQIIASVNTTPDNNDPNDNKVNLWQHKGSLMKTLPGSNSAVNFSADNQMLVSASQDSTVQLWRGDGTFFKTLQGKAIDGSFSPDGRTIALINSNNTVGLFSTNGKPIATLKGDQNKINFSFSPDGRTIALVTSNNTVGLFSTDGKLIVNLKGHQNRIETIRFSPDGKYLATISEDKTIKLWRRDGTKTTTLTMEGDIERVQIGSSPNGKTLVIFDGSRTIKFLRQNGQEIKTYKADEEISVKFSPDGQLVTIKTQSSFSSLKDIKLWNIDGILLKTLPVQSEFSSRASLVGFTPDSQTIFIKGGGKAQFWSRNGKPLSTFDKAFITGNSPDLQTLLSVEGNNKIKLWNRNGIPIKTITLKAEKLKLEGGYYNSTIFSPDGQTLAIPTDKNTVEVWRIDGSFLKSVQLHLETEYERFGNFIPSQHISFSSDSQTLAIRTRSKNKVQFLRVHGKASTKVSPLKTIIGDWIENVSSIPNSGIIAIVGGNDTVKLWQLPHKQGKEAKVLRTSQGHSNLVTSVSISPDGKIIASASHDNTVKLWQRDGKLLRTFTKHTDKVNSVSFSPDGKLLASASDDKTVRVWQPDGTVVKTFKDHGNGVTSVTFSRDGKMIASASKDDKVKLWNLDGKEIKTLNNDEPVTSVSFNLDGKTIALAGEKTVKLWSIDGTSPITFERFGSKHVSFSPDGKSIAAASDDGVSVWNFDLNELLKRGCNAARDYLKNNPKVQKSDRTLCDDIK